MARDGHFALSATGCALRAQIMSERPSLARAAERKERDDECDVTRALQTMEPAMQMKRRTIKDSSLRLSSGKWRSSSSPAAVFESCHTALSLARPLFWHHRSTAERKRVRNLIARAASLILDAENFFAPLAANHAPDGHLFELVD